MGSIKHSIQYIWEKNWPGIYAAFSGGVPQFIFASHPHNLIDEIPVFCYHCVDARDFETDLVFLSNNGYITIDADTLLDHLAMRKKAPKNSVVLTFDDGSRNLYHTVFPLLKRYGMKAVAFLATKFHDEKFEHSVYNTVNSNNHPLNWSQIMEMHDSGIIDFQSHTHEHRYIPRWPEISDLEGSDVIQLNESKKSEITVAEDLKLSKDKLEAKLNKTIRHLAFPRCNGTEEALCIGESLGYEAFWWCVLPGRKGNRPGQSPRFIVRIAGRYLRRLPGDGRKPLHEIIIERYSQSAIRLLNYVKDIGQR